MVYIAIVIARYTQASADASPGIMIQTSASSSLVVNTSRATFPLTDPSELIPVLSESISFQLLGVILPAVMEGPNIRKGMIFVDEMEEVISLGDRGNLS